MVIVARVPLDVPIDLGRDEAAGLARAELTDPVYRAAEPSPLQKALQWLLERLSEGLDRVVQAAPGGWIGLIGLAVVIVLVLVVLRWRVGPLGQRAAAQDPLFAGRVLTADDHRRAAEGLAGTGDYAGAVRERLRGLVRGLEERELLDPRPGRTADDVAREAGAMVPEHAALLRRAVRAFDDVWYGGRAAGPGHYATLVEADQALRQARPARMTPAGVPPVDGPR